MKKKLCNQNQLINKPPTLLKRLERENTTLVESAKDQEEFAINFMICWKVLELYGKKQEEYNQYYSIFFECLQDLSGIRVNRAMKQYLKINKKFPTPAHIREIVNNYDYELMEEEKLYRKMHMRAKTKSFGEHHLNNIEKKQLEEYEKENGEINYKVRWEIGYTNYFKGKK